MFAIIATGGKQYKVEKGMVIEVEKLDVEEGKSVTFEEVLLVDDDGKTKVGTPTVKGAKVTAKAVSQKRGEKVVVFKMKPKKRYQKTQGHRQSLTELEITEIKV